MQEVFIVCIEWNKTVINQNNLHQLMTILPNDIQEKLKKFYHAEDSWRSLIGQFLPRYWLTRKAIPLDQIAFGKTEHGKPLIIQSPAPMSYNVTHDSDMVAIACGTGNAVGIDTMRIALPRNTTMNEFVEFVSDQLTAREKAILLPTAADEPTRLLRLYRMWTVKEAYTKALGEGLGYDFARIEYDVVNQVVTVDGKEPRDWEITSFLVQHLSDTYVVSTACEVKGNGSVMRHLDSPPDGLVSFVEVETLARECGPQT
ncbi:4'-phosphopantetheinyl transferase [Ceratobasidium sp. AG-I]|nr:4'-phosphopantetheinyl transferase [Ceratobasidium sp. AG-I]